MTELNSGSTDLVAKMTSVGGDAQTAVYAGTTTSGTLVRESTARVGANLTPDYMEAMTETVERSRGLIDGGFKLSLTLPESFGGWGFSLERQPRTETRTTKRAVYGSEDTTE